MTAYVSSVEWQWGELQGFVPKVHMGTGDSPGVHQGQSGPELSAEIWTLEKSHSQQKGELREQAHLQTGDKQACVFQWS